MELYVIGYNHRHPSSFSIDHGKSTSWLMLIVKTPSVFTIDDEEIEITKPCVIIYTTGVPQKYRANGGEYIDDWFYFMPDTDEQKFIESLEIPLNRPIVVGDVSEISSLARMLFLEWSTAEPLAADAIDLYGRLLFIKLSRLYTENTVNPTANDLDNYSEYLELRQDIYRYPINNRRVDEMAVSLHVSTSHFHHTYKRLFGTSVKNDIISSKIKYIKRLLVTTDYTVVKIAELCGYSCSDYLIRQFKKYVGKTPTEYRNNTL